MSDPSTDTIKKLGTTGVLKTILGSEITDGLEMTARKYFEKSSPKTQCVQGGPGHVIPYVPGITGSRKGSIQTCTKCYICGLPILENRKKETGMFSECEHVLPIIAAAIYLKLYSYNDKGKSSEKLQLEYKWAHNICNQVKLDYWPLYIGSVKGGGKTIRYQSKSATMGKTMGKSLRQLEYVDGTYNLQRILTEDIEPLKKPKGAATGDLMRVSEEGVQELLLKIWHTERKSTDYFKKQLVKIYGTDAHFIHCRSNHVMNIYQEIADHINSVTVGGHGLANLMTLVGLSQIDPKMYRPEQATYIENMEHNPAKVRKEGAAIMVAAETLIDLKAVDVDVPDNIEWNAQTLLSLRDSVRTLSRKYGRKSLIASRKSKSTRRRSRALKTINEEQAGYN